MEDWCMSSADWIEVLSELDCAKGEEDGAVDDVVGDDEGEGKGDTQQDATFMCDCLATFLEKSLSDG